jgi:hypothetical protein
MTLNDIMQKKNPYFGLMKINFFLKYDKTGSTFKIHHFFI